MNEKTQPNPELRISGEQARIIIINTHELLHYKFRGVVLWSLVGSITGHGSGYSAEICKTANLDPFQKCGVKNLKDWKPKTVQISLQRTETTPHPKP